MKLIQRLLLAVLLVAPAAAALADAPVVSPEPQPPASPAPVTEEDLFSPAADCDPAAEAVTPIEGQETLFATGTCGSCSSSNCVGAPRGQICHLGSGMGWGNCNIYSGGYRCSTGGWECSCGTGPLP